MANYSHHLDIKSFPAVDILIKWKVVSGIENGFDSTDLLDRFELHFVVSFFFKHGVESTNIWFKWRDELVVDSAASI